MTLLDTLRTWWHGTDGERPPKPDDELVTESFDTEELTVRVEFENGDTEHIGCYGVYYDDGVYTFEVAVDPVEWFGDDVSLMTTENREIPAAVLACEPETVDSVPIRRTYDIHYTHTWGHPHGLIMGSKSWRRRMDDYALMMEEVRDD